MIWQNPPAGRRCYVMKLTCLHLFSVTNFITLCSRCLTQPFDELMEEVLAADGKTCDYFMNEMMSKDQQHRQQPGQQQQPPKDSKETGKPPLQRPGNYAVTS